MVDKLTKKIEKQGLKFTNYSKSTFRPGARSRGGHARGAPDRGGVGPQDIRATGGQRMNEGPRSDGERGFTKRAPSRDDSLERRAMRGGARRG